MVAVTYAEVRDSLPSGSSRYREWSSTPATTSGWAAWINSARIPPAKAETSPITRHDTAPGPNSPGSPRCESVAASGYSA